MPVTVTTMAVMMMAAHGRLSQILNVGELATLRSIREIRRELVKLVRHDRIAVGLRGLRSALQVRGDLRSHLLILGGVGLLELLKFAHHLSERRKLLVICR